MKFWFCFFYPIIGKTKPINWIDCALVKVIYLVDSIKYMELASGVIVRKEKLAFDFPLSFL